MHAAFAVLSLNYIYFLGGSRRIDAGGPAMKRAEKRRWTEEEPPRLRTIKLKTSTVGRVSKCGVLKFKLVFEHCILF